MERARSPFRNRLAGMSRCKVLFMRCQPPSITTVALSSRSRPSILKDALTVRNTVFGEEERLLSKPDQDTYDGLGSTTHVVVYWDSRPVATARILLPNREVAHAEGRSFGIAVEELLNLSPLKESGMIPAESGRVAVLKRYRKTAVIQRLLACIYWVSQQAGVDVLVAVANAETDATDDAWLMAEVASAQLLDGPWRVAGRAPSFPPTHPSTTFYKEPHWELARQGRLSELPLPGVLKLFTHKMGARVMGAPLYIPEFSRWAFPISALLSEMPEQPLEQLIPLEHEARCAG